MTQLRIDPQPTFALSPHLFMQFMEPLGTTDPSVEASWDFQSQQWDPEFVDVVKDLGPTCIRWGGIFASFWKWREGVGPRSERAPMYNYLWGGMETNQVGLHEYLDLCEEVGADPLICVNFAADGRPEYMKTSTGENRAGTAEEAADLVSYCNDPDHPERRRNGRAEPWSVRLWQIGNETSYPKAGRRFTVEENADRFATFARAMRERDPSIQLIGWGCQEGNSGPWWAKELIERAGQDVDYVGSHTMMQTPARRETVLKGYEYRNDYDRAWDELLEIFANLEPRLSDLESLLEGLGSDASIALTEGHLSLSPHNTCTILNEWISGLYHAKVFNLYERHGERVKIATLADFAGNRWTVNAVMVGGRSQRPYLQPVGVVARLYRRHIGERALVSPDDVGPLDVTASRTGDRIYLHVVNTDLHRSVSVDLAVLGHTVTEGRGWEIAPGVSAYVDHDRRDTLDPVEKRLEVRHGETPRWTFPPASVTALDLVVSSNE